MNRSILFFCFLLFLPGWAAAQAYEPMVVEGAHWRVRHATNSTPIEPGPNFMIGYVAKGDTMVDSIVYKKIYYTSLESVNGNFTPPFHITYGPVLVAGIREDTLAKKVFSRSFDVDLVYCSDSLLYDFSLATGDTVDLCIQPLMDTVSQDTQLFLWGKSRRVLYVPAIGAGFYIEGVGSSYGLFEALGQAIGQRTQITLVDYCVGSDWDCSILTGLEDKLSDHHGMKVFPNPAQEHLQVAYCPGSYLRQPLLHIHNSAGQLVTEHALPPGGACLETEISLAPLPAGLYHVALYEQGRLLAGGRVVLQ